MKKNNLYKTKKAHSVKLNPKLRTAFIALFIAIIIIAIVFVALKDRVVNDNTFVPSTELEKYEYYVGPQDHVDRGMWTSPGEYYSLFGKDAKETDIIEALFGKGEKKGLVPVGIRLTPALLSYDDYKPYKGPMQHGFIDAYSVTSTMGSEEITEPVEYKWGLEELDLKMDGGYNIKRNNQDYQSRVELTVSNVEYYVVDSFDPNAETEVIGISKSDYGFLVPYFNFEYSGSGESSHYDSSGNLLGTKEFELSGSLKDASWEFTPNLTGQNTGLFKTGSIYIRCKLPCQVKETDYTKGSLTVNTYDDFANIYFSIDGIMIGTWFDCEK